MTIPITPRSLLYICTSGFISILLLGLYNPSKVIRLIPSSLHNVISLASNPKADLFAVFSNISSNDSHPIEKLITDARHTHEGILKERSFDLTLSGIRYRKRRKRHPPPGFDKWVEYAIEHDAVIVEKFFDRIYHDLKPFWAVDAKIVAESAANWDHVVQVRDGQATPIGDTTNRVAWLTLWTELVAECAQYLPDVDMPINYMDEARLLVPWVEIDRLVTTARQSQGMIPAQDTVQTFHKGVRRTNIEEHGPELHRPDWITSFDIPVWDHVAASCPPNSKSHNISMITDLSTAPEFPPSDADISYAEHGYVKNVTASTDPCLQPHLRGLHGTFIEPLSLSVSKKLFPLFSGSKIPTNNDILIPGAMYLTDDPFYSGGKSYGPPWRQKTSNTSWRGVGSGGRHKAENWRHFQRQRLIEMLNGTTVTNVQLNNAEAMTFHLPPVDKYPSALQDSGNMGRWLTDHADAGFVDILCFPPDGNCDYLSEYFHTVPSKPMVKQYSSKFIIDVDGNSFSARYRALLLSTSAPIKSTVYAEWHDERLQPWLHYIPMDNTFQDLYGLLDYFTRNEKGDAAAHWIADSGKTWAESTLRREDMLLYVWRLLLEFARICDENRNKLAYVDDLVAGGRY